MLSVFTAGLLAGSLLGWTVLAGLAFAIGCAAAARYTRPADLLTVVVTPPLLFFAALVAVKTVTATGNLLLSVAEGTALTLAALAPWLIAGVTLTLIVTWIRGLPRCVRALRADLRPRRPK